MAGGLVCQVAGDGGGGVDGTFCVGEGVDDAGSGGGFLAADGGGELVGGDPAPLEAA